MNLRNLLRVRQQTVFAGTPDMSIADAAEKMEAHHIGLLPICGPDGEPLGVVLERDTARTASAAASPK